MNPTPDDTAVAEVPSVVEAAHGHGACDNCQAALQGHYCHHCGQSAHNPLKHVGHAIEEVFESFWHLDGRIFRTLRRLLAPAAWPRTTWPAGACPTCSRCACSWCCAC